MIEKDDDEERWSRDATRVSVWLLANLKGIFWENVIKFTVVRRSLTLASENFNLFINLQTKICIFSNLYMKIVFAFQHFSINYTLNSIIRNWMLVVDLLTLWKCPRTLWFSLKWVPFSLKHAVWYKINKTYKAFLQHWKVEMGDFDIKQTEQGSFKMGVLGAKLPDTLEIFLSF